MMPTVSDRTVLKGESTQQSCICQRENTKGNSFCISVGGLLREDLGGGVEDGTR